MKMTGKGRPLILTKAMATKKPTMGRARMRKRTTLRKNQPRSPAPAAPRRYMNCFRVSGPMMRSSTVMNWGIWYCRIVGDEVVGNDEVGGSLHLLTKFLLEGDDLEVLLLEEIIEFSKLRWHSEFFLLRNSGSRNQFKC